MHKNTTIIIMAAGKGKRMKSSLPKVLHEILGRSLLEHLLLTAFKLNPARILVIIGNKAELVKDTIEKRMPEDIYKKIEWIEQQEQLGTGDAVRQCTPVLKNFNGPTIILSGDVPLLTSDTLNNLLKFHQKEKAVATILTTHLDNPFGYGRILRTDTGQVVGIVEEKDAMTEEKHIKEINTGTYCFDWQVLAKILPSLRNDNAQDEYYLTDVIHILNKGGKTITAYKAQDSVETLGISDRKDLANIIALVQKRINSYWMELGITIIDPSGVYIDYDVIIGKDTIIYPFTMLQGKTRIGETCQIGPCTHLLNAVIGNEVKIRFSLINNSTILNYTEVGPFAHLREGTQVGNHCKVGNFVEIKKSKLHSHVKSAHLTYLGDSELGSYTNIGAGTITCNYDGFKKHKTNIGERVFVGSNSTLIAPVTLADDTYIGAGSVINRDVPKGSLAVAREKQQNKEGWVEYRRKKQQGK